MVDDAKGGDLFIVDNSISGWTGLRYFREWCDIAKGFDIATGFFEIGALLDLDEQWQQLGKRTWRRSSTKPDRRCDHWSGSTRFNGNIEHSPPSWPTH